MKVLLWVLVTIFVTQEAAKTHALTVTEIPTCTSWLMGAVEVEISVGTHIIRGTLQPLESYLQSLLNRRSPHDPPLRHYGVQKIRSVKPHNGPGRFLIVETVERSYTNQRLWKVAIQFPKFFSRFEIYATPQYLVLPNGVRLNGHMTNGVRFLDIPFNHLQEYKTAYFDDAFGNQGLVPLASREGAFVHDRIDEHLLGALIMPNWLLKKIQLYPKFVAAISTLKMVKENHGLQAFIKDESELWSHSALWDTSTQDLGKYVPYTNTLGKVLHRLAVDLTPSIDSVAVRRILWQYRDEKLRQEIHNLSLQFLSETITEEKAEADASQIIREMKEGTNQ